MAQKQLQDSFLESLKQAQTPVSIFLMSGIKLHGIIDDYDTEVIMLKGIVTQMIFKHAISTVVPGK